MNKIANLQFENDDETKSDEEELESTLIDEDENKGIYKLEKNEDYRNEKRKT